jgi:hypothetical protein
MSARPKQSVVYLPPVADQKFLRNVVDVLDKLQADAELRGLGMLGSLLAIAKGEAEDGINTRKKELRLTGHGQDDASDGAAMLAQKFAYRADTPV